MPLKVSLFLVSAQWCTTFGLGGVLFFGVVWFMPEPLNECLFFFGMTWGLPGSMKPGVVVM